MAIAKSQNRCRDKRSLNIKPYFIMGMILLLIVGGTIVFVRSRQQKSQDDGEVQNERHHKIIEKPRAKKSATEIARDEKPKPLPPQKIGEVRDGYVLLPNGKRHKRNGMKEIKVSEWNNKGRYQIFDSFTDNEFATLLTLKPGEMLIGGGVFPKDYEARFLKSLETPIIVSKDDPDDIKDVKRAVIQTRLEMKAALDRGEDIRQYVKAAYEEAQKLASYKDVIAEELRNLRSQPDLTDDDIDVFVEAANKMLESKGIAPIKVGPLTRWRLLNQRIKEDK